MVVTLEQVYGGVANYVEQEIAKNMTGINKFFAYFIIPSIPNKINELLYNYKSFLEIYVDDNGNIKIDDLYNAMKRAMQRTLQFEWNGIIFKEEDIDCMYRHIVS